MIPAIIVSIVIVCAISGYIAFFFLYKKKKSAADADKTAQSTADILQTSDEGELVIDECATVAEEEPKLDAAASVIDEVMPTVGETEIIAAGENSGNEIAKAATVAEEEPKLDAAASVIDEVVPTVGETEILEAGENSGNEIAKAATVAEEDKTQYIVIKYSKSFLAKLIQSDSETKSYYSHLKNRLMSYKGVKSRISWKWESFRFGRKTLAKLRLCGKTLALCLALDTEDYANSKYKVKSLADNKSFANTPCMYRIKKSRHVKYGEQLIAALMEANGITEKPIEEIDYAVKYPYETTEALIGRALIKVLTEEDAQSGTAFKPSEVRERVTAQEVDALMRDEVAATLIKESDAKSDKTKTGIVNIDTLSQHFKSGEAVTLDEIKKRVKGFNKQVTYLKVLARGTLDKPLTVEGDKFSLQAVKMIVLTGGTVIKKAPACDNQS